MAELPHASVPVTVIVAEQVPEVLAVLVTELQLSVAVVWAMAAASASATVL